MRNSWFITSRPAILHAPISPTNPSVTPPSGLSPAPTPVRWLIVSLLFSISVVTYIDRVNISVTARHMMPALGLTEQHMGFIFSAFVVGYALFQIPGGWLGDRWGARLVLTVALLWWSGFTAFTAMAPASSLAGAAGILGALIMRGAMIGAGAVVTRDVPDYAIVAGVPARVIGDVRQRIEQHD